MSSAGNWTYIYQLTIWPVTYDDYSQAIYGTPYLIMADWMVGGALSVDASGAEFVPQSTYYFEAPEGSPLIPLPQSYILRGDHRGVARPVDINAEKIKAVGGWPMGAFGANELPDWRILT